MDLFSDFSFAAAGASNRRSAYLNDLDMEEISPSSSRSTTPVAADLPEPPSPMAPPVTIDQLSVRLNRHHIDPSAYPSAAPLCVRLHKPAERRHAVSIQPSSDYFDTVRRRRAEGARHLCSGSRLASIETLVDRMLRDGTSCYASLHPSSASSSRQASRQNSVTSAPTSMPSPNLRSHSDDMTSEEDDSDDGPTSPAMAADPRLAKLRFGAGAAAAKKGHGIEKSSKPRRKVAGKR